MIKIQKMGPSENPNAIVDPTDSRFNLTRETDPSRAPRRYYVLEFMDPEDPMCTPRKRVITQNYNSAGVPVWRVGNPEIIQEFIGKNIPGEIEMRYVKPYFVVSRDGKAVHEGQPGNWVDKFETVVFKHESVEAVFEAQGLEIVEEQTKSLIERPKKVRKITPLSAVGSTPASTPATPEKSEAERKILEAMHEEK